MVKRMTSVAKAVASHATEPLVRHTKTFASAADRSGDPGVYAGLWPNRDPALRAAIDHLLTRQAEPAARPD